jgi:hypothetical protein
MSDPQGLPGVAGMLLLLQCDTVPALLSSRRQERHQAGFQGACPSQEQFQEQPW